MRLIRRRLLAILTIVFIVISGELVFADTTQKHQELIQPPIKITEAFKNIPHNPDSEQNKNILPNPNCLMNSVFYSKIWEAEVRGKEEPMPKQKPVLFAKRSNVTLVFFREMNIESKVAINTWETEQFIPTIA